jgi:hypothetical protein
MGITVEMVVGVIVLTLLGVLLTGPGLWSEKWGWGWLRGRRTRGRGRAGGGEPPAAPPRPGEPRR